MSTNSTYVYTILLRHCCIYIL